MAETLRPGRWQRAAHLHLLSQRLSEAALTPGGRLVVTAPPRHGKSSLVACFLPIWYLALFPDRHVILVSHTAALAEQWGRLVRNTVLEAGARLGLGMTEDSTATARWHTPEGGSMRVMGVGGPITGLGADCLVIDDPCNGWSEANSPAVRENLWAWWNSTCLTRLEPGASVVVSMARWTQEDLVGKILRADRDGWPELRLPALAEAGDPLGRPLGAPLWPERWPLEALQEIQRTSPESVWAALYQQRPLAGGEAVFLPWAVEGAMEG
jgi:hypothetical protein